MQTTFNVDAGVCPLLNVCVYNRMFWVIFMTL